MLTEHHDLYVDFPEMRDAVDALREHNPYFRRTMNQYSRLTGRVEDLEEHDMPVADFTMEDMKKVRVHLKDQLYHFLLAYRQGQGK
ncbi:MAG: DUF465 domain-containing protein [Zoogloeaceae bacterium]|jgi:uncharacterized protein YdcH (DUF465 family)|nr:DUF465 domain-containing protein [Zoogloeaceae bacterium]